MKWGEYSNDVQFILQRSALEPKTSNGPSGLRPGGHPRVEPPSRATLSQGPQATQDRQRQSLHTHKDLKKSLTFSGGHADLRRQDAGTPSPSQSGPPLPQGMMSPTVPRHGDFSYSSPPSTHWEGQMLAGEACKGDQQPYPVSWRPPAPPPYELVRGNPPPPPSASRIGVDNVRATSHWSAPWPGSHSPPPTSQPPPTLSPHTPMRSPPAAEPPYSLARRDQRSEPHSLARTEPVYSDSRRAPYPGYAHQGTGSLNTTPPGPQFHPCGPSPSQTSPMYNGPPPPKPPHIAGPRELPPYRHPPPPSTTPTKITPSHGSPRKIANVSQTLPPVQTSPSKQPPPLPAQVPLLSNKVPNPHQMGSSAHSSPIRHPSPTRHSSPTRHPSPSRSSVINSPSPHSNTKNPRSSSPVKTMQARHGLEEFPGCGIHDKGIPKPVGDEQSITRLGEFHLRKDDGANSDITKDVMQSNNVNNSIGKSPPDSHTKGNQHNRGTIDRLAVESVSVFGRRGTSEEPFINKDSAHSNCSERLNTSLDSTLSNHCIKSPHTRRSPAKVSAGSNTLI